MVFIFMYLNKTIWYSKLRLEKSDEIRKSHFSLFLHVVHSALLVSECSPELYRSQFPNLWVVQFCVIGSLLGFRNGSHMALQNAYSHLWNAVRWKFSIKVKLLSTSSQSKRNDWPSQTRAYSGKTLFQNPQHEKSFFSTWYWNIEYYKNDLLDKEFRL